MNIFQGLTKYRVSYNICRVLVCVIGLTIGVNEGLIGFRGFSV